MEKYSKIKNNSIKDKLIWNECKKLKEDYPIISQYCDIVEKIKNLEGRVDDIDTQKRIQEKKERFEKELNNIRTLDKQNGDNISKYEDLRLKQNKIFFYERYYVSKILKQGLFVGSLISDLQEKMKHKGKSTEEINQVLENYVQGFCSNIDFEQISEIFGYDKNYIKRELLNILNNGEKKYSEKLAGYYEGDKKIYDETIYNVNKKYDSFYEKLSNAMIKQLEQQMNKEQASKLIYNFEVEQDENVYFSMDANEDLNFKAYINDDKEINIKGSHLASIYNVGSYKKRR